MIEPENDIDPLFADAETLTELVKRQDIPTIEKNKRGVLQNSMEP